jgi:hypothetical protein
MLSCDVPWGPAHTVPTTLGHVFWLRHTKTAWIRRTTRQTTMTTRTLRRMTMVACMKTVTQMPLQQPQQQKLGRALL